MGDVSVLIPFTSTEPHRHAALQQTIAQYHNLGWETVIGHSPQPWVKAHAVHHAAQQATGTLYVIADADCLCPNIPAAVQAVTDGAPWAMPHRWVHRTTPPDQTEQQRHHQAVRGGGIVALTADTWHNIPLDPRFTGWGHEDHSWGLALDCLAGPCHQGDETITHLWHPPQERLTRRIGSESGRQLERRYWAARNNREAMTALIDEAKEALWTRLAS